jgi:glycosyltransferase involved in cell wall biosynthesis
MKILLANKYFYLKGGAENSFFETAKLLKQKGHEVSFFSMRDRKNLSCPYEKYFVSNVDYEKKGLRNSIATSLKLLYSFEAKKKIDELLVKVDPAIAHLNVIYHQISPSIIDGLDKRNIPMVMSLRDYKLICASYTMMNGVGVCEDCKGARYFHCFLNKCVKQSSGKSLLNTVEMYLHHKILKIYDKVRVFISPSMFLKKKMAEMGFKGNIAHIPNFVNLSAYQPDFKGKDRSIVYFGRLSKEKGLLTLVNAVKGIPGLKLKIIGDGPEKEALRSFVQENADNTVFYDHMSGTELKNQVRSSMFVVVPSEWYENNPRSVIEGFALGKPAIGANIGGIPELVVDNVTGLTFDPGNTGQLREKIVYLAQRPKLVEQMGENARLFIEHNLNQEIHYQKLIDIYNQAMRG